MSAATIDEVIDALDAIIDESTRKSDRIGYFAALYRKVTAEVRDSVRRGEFMDGQRMERLDVRFANRYLDALVIYRAGGSGGALTETWRVTFDACADRRPTILQHLYAGLAAHLLLDLGIAAAEIAPGARLPDLRSDFDHINDVVGRLMRQVDAIIGSVSPWIGVIDRIAGVEYAAMNEIGISVARDLAWHSATNLASLTDGPRASAEKALDRRAAFVAKQLLKPTLPLRFLAGIIHAREKKNVADVIRALRGPTPTPASAVKKRVAILGGGVGGLTAAHELITRGFDVDVYEETNAAGGKAKSQTIPGTGTNGNPDLRGEHGFRFFPSFYRHVIDTMQRIPTPDGNVAARLRQSAQMGMAETNTIYLFDRHPPEDAKDLTSITETVGKLFSKTKIPEADVTRLAHAMLRFTFSCDERRRAVFEKMSFWDFVGGDQCSDAMQRYISTPRFMVAMDPKNGSARTIAMKGIQIMADFGRNGTRTDAALDGPSTDRWLTPWIDELVKLGVRFNYGKTVTSLQVSGNRITGVTVNGGAIRADHYVLAVPLDRVQSLITDTLVAAEPAFAGIRQLNGATSWMVGAQFYFSEELDICHGHVAYPSAPWALSSVSQRNFWGTLMMSLGAGNVKDILSVDISDWDTKAPDRNGKPGKAARECTEDELLDEVWAQLKDAVGDKVDLTKLLRRRLDNNVVFSPSAPTQNKTPLLVHPPDSWSHRPGPDLRIENLFIASDYVKTNTDLASMEGANEAARRAVNALLQFEQSSAQPCQIWPMDEGLGPLQPLVEVAKQLDRKIYNIEVSAPALARFEGVLALLHAPPPVTLDALAKIEKEVLEGLRVIHRLSAAP
jgi:uncharacterized protein with NAD-binding domain and iron-sulfur cluster